MISARFWWPFWHDTRTNTYHDSAMDSGTTLKSLFNATAFYQEDSTLHI